MYLLRRKGNALIEKNTETIIYNCNDILRQNRIGLVDLANGIINEYMRGFPISKIENITDNFLNEMQNLVKQQAQNIANKMHQNYEQLLKGIEDTKKEKSIYAYYESLNDTFKNIKFAGTDDLLKDFIRSIIRNITMYCDPFNDIDSSRFDIIIDNIRYALSRELNKQVLSIVKNSKIKIGEVIATNYQKTLENIKEYENRDKEITTNDIAKFMPVIDKSNYELIKEKEKYYIRDSSSLKKYPFTIDGEYLILEGNKILFIANNKTQGYTNKENGISIALTEQGLAISKTIKASCKTILKNHTYQRVITKTEKGYTFMYNEKEYRDKISMLVIAEEMEKEAPKYYQELLKDDLFKATIDDLKAYDKIESEIETDKKTGKISINPAKIDELIEKFYILGYELYSIDGEYYIKDLMTGEEHLAVPSKGCWGIGMEGVLSKDFNINTNITYVGENNITNGINEFNKGNMTVIFRNDLDAFFLYFKDGTYIIEKTEYGIKCRKQNGSKKNQITDEEMFEILNGKMPYLAKHLEEHIMEMKGLSSSEETIEK